MPDLSHLHQHWMKRAQTLAQLGLGKASPNPLVGCVIVHENQIIGEGWHKQYGGPHAEVEAIRTVSNHDLLAESTVYVTLEPCAHVGKTPPCADLLIDKKVPRVVIGHLDPHPLVAGKGLNKLQQAGIQVEVGIMEKECRYQNRRFLTVVEKGRPYIILKWAQSADGFMGRKGEKIWVSSPASKILVHKWRTEEDAFLVGANTVVNDNPRLNARLWHGSDPYRVMIDPDRKIPDHAHVLDGTQPSMLFSKNPNSDSNVMHEMIPEGNQPEQKILENLVQKGIQSVVIEGGAFTLNRFISLNLWDEARIFVSRHTIHEGIAAPTFSIKPQSRLQIDTDELLMCFNTLANEI